MSLRLSPGEQIVFKGHPCWRAILGFYLKGVLAAAALGAIAALIGWGGGGVFLVVLVVLALTALVGFLRRAAIAYTITNRRLNIKRGILAREVQETRLERVQNVNYSQSIYQRLARIGDVNFDTAASEDYDFVFYGVADPGGVVQAVDRATGGEGLGEGFA